MKSRNLNLDGLLEPLQAVYKDQWWDAILMLIERSKQQEIDEGIGYKAGFIWTTLYDLAGAVDKKSIKNPDVMKLYIAQIAKEYKLNTLKLWNIFSTIPGNISYDGIYFQIYILLDKGFNLIDVDEDEGVIEGFRIIGNKLLDESRIGYLLDHIGDLKL